jgi:hypothetical protein
MMVLKLEERVEDSMKYYLQMPNSRIKKKYRFTYYSSKGDFFNIIIGKFKNKSVWRFIYYHDDDSENKTSDYYINY